MGPLLELLISMLISTLLFCFSLSSYQNWQDQHNLKNTLNLLYNQIELSKTLSLIRFEPIYLCASLNLKDCNQLWEGRLIIFESSSPPLIQTILFQSTALQNTVHIRYQAFNTPLYVRFAPGGELNYNGRFTLQSLSHTAYLTLSTTGVATEGEPHFKIQSSLAPRAL